MHLMRKRTYAVVAAATFIVGAALIVFGIVADHLPYTIAGAAIAISTQAAVSLCAVRRWTTNTAHERRALRDAQLQADESRARYRAAEYAIEAERKRLRHDAIAAGRRADATLQAELDALHQQFEEKRAALIGETLETAFHMINDGKLFEPTRPGDARGRGREVIPFPVQPADHERARGRDVSS